MPESHSKIFRLGLLAALYFAQGVPWGFITVSVALHLSNLGMGAAEIAQLSAIGYWPWVAKPLLGPLIDLARFGRWGQRRPLIAFAELAMAITVLVLATIDPKTSFVAFLALVFVHNLFAALQDVATDGLAVTLLPPDERGTGNGVMTAAKHLGILAGGPGVAMVAARGDFRIGALVCAAFVLVPIAPLVRLREPTRAAAPAPARQYLRAGLRAFASPVAALAVLFALLFAASEGFLYPFMIPLLRQQLGFSEEQVGLLFALSGGAGALFGLLGGWLSDRLGRRTTLLAAALGAMACHLAMAALGAHWDAFAVHVGFALASGAFAGVLYAAQLALFMDLTHPAVAATQFQIYMSLVNLRITWSTWLGGQAPALFTAPVMFVVAVALDALALPLLRWFSPLRIARAVGERRDACGQEAPPLGEGRAPE